MIATRPRSCGAGTPAARRRLARLEARGAGGGRARRARGAAHPRAPCAATAIARCSRFTRRFDGVALAARRRCACRPTTWPRRTATSRPRVRRDLALAARRIRAFHAPPARALVVASATPSGARLGQLHQAARRVGVYVPGGRAAYPSTVLMTALPARVAGVDEVDRGVAGRDRRATRRSSSRPATSPASTRSTASAARRRWRRWPTARRPSRASTRSSGRATSTSRRRSGCLRAGRHRLHRRPERGADPRRRLGVARGRRRRHAGAGRARPAGGRDLRHARSPARRGASRRRSPSSSPRCRGARIAARSLARFGAIVVTASLAEAVALANRLAPEHLELLVRTPRRWVPRIRHAGAVFVGPHTPEAFGDYLAGPNHVLPTGGTARFASPLGVYDFVKRTSLIEAGPRTLARLGPAVARLARLEGLDGARALGRAPAREPRSRRTLADPPRRGRIALMALQARRAPARHKGRVGGGRAQDQGDRHPARPRSSTASGRYAVKTGIPFLDHMLELFAQARVLRPDRAGARRSRGRLPPHGRGRRAGARPGAARGARRQGRHPPLRRGHRAARRGARADGGRPLRAAVPRLRRAASSRRRSAASTSS